MTAVTKALIWLLMGSVALAVAGCSGDDDHVAYIDEGSIVEDADAADGGSTEDEQIFTLALVLAWDGLSEDHKVTACAMLTPDAIADLLRDGYVRDGNNAVAWRHDIAVTFITDMCLITVTDVDAGTEVDPHADEVAESYGQCVDGDMAACDSLYAFAPPGSDEEKFGHTCGNRQPEGDYSFCDE